MHFKFPDGCLTCFNSSKFELVDDPIKLVYSNYESLKKFGVDHIRYYTKDNIGSIIKIRSVRIFITLFIYSSYFFFINYSLPFQDYF